MLVVGGGEMTIGGFSMPMRCMAASSPSMPGSTDIHQHHVRIELGGFFHRLVAVHALADHDVPADLVEQFAQTVARQLFIVHDQYSRVSSANWNLYRHAEAFRFLRNLEPRRIAIVAFKAQAQIVQGMFAGSGVIGDLTATAATGS
jgi:hypothetical protein